MSDNSIEFRSPSLLQPEADPSSGRCRLGCGPEIDRRLPTLGGLLALLLVPFIAYGESLEDHKAAPHIKASFEKREKQGWNTQIIPWQRVPEDVK